MYQHWLNRNPLSLKGYFSKMQVTNESGFLISEMYWENFKPGAQLLHNTMSLPLSTTATSFLSACTPSCRPNVLPLQAVRVLLFIDHSSFRSLEYPYVDTPTHSVSLGFISRRILILIRSANTTQLHNLQQQATTVRIPRWKQREERLAWPLHTQSKPRSTSLWHCRRSI